MLAASELEQRHIHSQQAENELAGLTRAHPELTYVTAPGERAE